jgi:hypothetical protein
MCHKKNVLESPLAGRLECRLDRIHELSSDEIIVELVADTISTAVKWYGVCRHRTNLCVERGVNKLVNGGHWGKRWNEHWAVFRDVRVDSLSSLALNVSVKSINAPCRKEQASNINDVLDSIAILGCVEESWSRRSKIQRFSNVGTRTRMTRTHSALKDLLC